MIWKRTSFNELREIAKTGFLVSLVSYVSFWLMDLVQPGFVSRYFSVHIFLLSALVFGGWWSMLIEEYVERAWIQLLASVASGFLLAVLIWSTTEGLDGYQLPLAIASFFIPWLILRVLKT